MKKKIYLLTLIFFFLLFNPCSAQNLIKKIPIKVQKIMDENPDFDYNLYGIAWGIATTKSGREMYWYSYINPDMYYQFQFSNKIEPEDSLVITKIKDGFNDSYQSSESWIGASNDWAFSDYSPSTCYKEYTGEWYMDNEGNKIKEFDEVSSLCAATTKYVKILRKVFKKFEVAAVNQVIVNEEYGWALKKK